MGITRMLKAVSIRLAIAISCCANLAVMADVPAAATGSDYAKITLLLSSRDADVRLGIKSVRRHGSIDEPMLELLAEMAWSACSGKRTMNPDTLAWLAKIIGESKQGRYARLVDDCSVKVTDKAPVKYFNLAKANLAETSPTNPYVGGNIDLDKVRDQVRKRRKPNPPESAMKKLFEDLRSEQRLDEVYSRLGAPDAISGVKVPRGKAGFMYVKVKLSDDRIEFQYPGQGNVRFGYDTSVDEWVLVDATSSNGLYWISRNGRFGSQIDVVTSGDAQELRQITRDLTKQWDPVDPALADRIADRIYFSQMETNDEMAESLAHMCKLLARSNVGKYKQIMREISEKAEHKTLRKHAGRVADALPDPAGESYVPKVVQN